MEDSIHKTSEKLKNEAVEAVHTIEEKTEEIRDEYNQTQQDTIRNINRTGEDVENKVHEMNRALTDDTHDKVIRGGFNDTQQNTIKEVEQAVTHPTGHEFAHRNSAYPPEKSDELRQWVSQKVHHHFGKEENPNAGRRNQGKREMHSENKQEDQDMNNNNSRPPTDKADNSEMKEWITQKVTDHFEKKALQEQNLKDDDSKQEKEDKQDQKRDHDAKETEAAPETSQMKPPSKNTNNNEMREWMAFKVRDHFDRKRNAKKNEEEKQEDEMDEGKDPSSEEQNDHETKMKQKIEEKV